MQSNEELAAAVLKLQEELKIVKAELKEVKAEVSYLNKTVERKKELIEILMYDVRKEAADLAK